MNTTNDTQAQRCAHTPGPWMFRAFHDGRQDAPWQDGFAIEAHPDFNNGFEICQIHGPDKAANARLIASAPRMAALIRTLYDLPQVTANLSTDTIREMQDCMVQAGIAK